MLVLVGAGSEARGTGGEGGEGGEGELLAGDGLRLAVRTDSLVKYEYLGDLMVLAG